MKSIISNRKLVHTVAGKHKFENPSRLAELDPENTLRAAGFDRDMTLCDIGAGTGIFAFQAARISGNAIYALEKSDAMIETLNQKKADQKMSNVIVKKVDSDQLPLADSICDMVLMSTVLHEVEDKTAILVEIKRILKEKGKLLIIEFHKRQTPAGPPESHRIAEELVEGICRGHGFKTIKKASLGENFYCILFKL